MARPLVLVLGGTRSGKSAFAVRHVQQLADGRPICYLATAEAGDPELDDRITRHRASRPSWPTIDVGTDLPTAVGAAGPASAILLDGVTLWLSALAPTGIDDMDELLDGVIASGLAALETHEGPAVLVSDEIGLGMVPIDAFARAFRDFQGIVHQRLAAMADEVYFTVAGLPTRIKPR